jgi:FG-GAP repeat
MRKSRSITFALTFAIVAGSAARADAAPNLQTQSVFPGAASSDYFGYSVAIDGDTAVIGALNDNAAKGAAYVYTRTGTTWSLQQELTAADGAADDEFGYAVAISGNTAMVSAAVKNNGQGYVYAFTRTGTTWAQSQEFTEPGAGAPDDCFGCALALSGTTALVGADGASGNVGSAFVYTSSGGTWVPQGQGFLGANVGDFFGFSVALSPAGNTAIVGAFGTASETGSAYVFTRTGTSWSQQTILAAGDPHAGDRFGYAVAAGTGTALVGAYASGTAGAAYAFTQSGTAWSQSSKLVPPDPTGADSFGASVALSGTTALVGAYERGGSLGPGAAYVYTGSGTGFSSPPQELFARGTGEYFGYAVALSGTTAVVGAIGAANDEGNAYLFAPGAAPPAAPALGSKAMLSALMFLLAGVGILGSRPRRAGRAC